MYNPFLCIIFTPVGTICTELSLHASIIFCMCQCVIFRTFKSSNARILIADNKISV